MDDLLPALVTSATRAPAQTSQATVDEVTAMINSNRASTEGYLNVSMCGTILYCMSGNLGKHWMSLAKWLPNGIGENILNIVHQHY